MNDDWARAHASQLRTVSPLLQTSDPSPPSEKIDAITTAKDVVACESLNVVVSQFPIRRFGLSVADDRVIRGASPAGIDVLYRGQWCRCHLGPSPRELRG